MKNKSELFAVITNITPVFAHSARIPRACKEAWRRKGAPCPDRRLLGALSAWMVRITDLSLCQSSIRARVG